MDFLQSWPGMGLMLLLLVGLIGTMLFLRNKKDDE